MCSLCFLVFSVKKKQLYWFQAFQLFCPPPDIFRGSLGGFPGRMMGVSDSSSPPSRMARLYRSVTTFVSPCGVWRAGRVRRWLGCGAEVVSGGGTEAISRGRRLLLILTLKTASFRRSVDKKKPDLSSLFSRPVKGNIRVFWLRAERRLPQLVPSRRGHKNRQECRTSLEEEILDL